MSKHTVQILAVLVAGALLGALPASAQDAVLYNICGYQGLEFPVNISDGNYSSLGHFNDKAGALKVSPGFLITLYSQKNFQGRSETFNASVECLYGTTIGPDAAESLTIERVPEPSPSPTPNATINDTNNTTAAPSPSPSPTPTPTSSPAVIVSTPAPSPSLPPSPSPSPTPPEESPAATPPPATPTPRQPGPGALSAIAALGAALVLARRRWRLNPKH